MCSSGICNLDGGCGKGDLEAFPPKFIDSRLNLPDKIEEKESLCSKCYQPGAIYKLKFRQAECCTCFLTYVNHKFRASLATSKVLPKNAKVLLQFDGTAESVVLLHMLYSAQTLSTHKRLQYSFVVLIVDDYYLRNEQNSKNSKNRTHYMNYLLALQDMLKCYESVEYYAMPFAKITEANSELYCLQSQLELYIHRDISEELQFIDWIGKIKSLTSQQDFVKCYKRKLFHSAAERFQCQFIFKAETSAQLATTMLTSIALGKGASCALDVHLIDDRYNDEIKIVRPLRDLSEIEIRLYLQACSLKCLPVSIFENLKNVKQSLKSVQNLTKDFVNDLQNSFSSTVLTINATGNKINYNEDVKTILLKNVNGSYLEASGYCCSWCNSLMDNKNSNTLVAVEFSRLVSENAVVANALLDLQVELEEVLERVGQSHFCYACRKIFGEVNKDNKLNLME